MNFSDWIKQFEENYNEAFAQPARLGALSGNDTKLFCMAVYKIVHNQADYRDWDLLDKQIHDYSLSDVIGWIGTILEMNGMDQEQIEAEQKWFKQELAKGYN